MSIISLNNSSITAEIQNILKSSLLIIITHLCYLFQINGILDGEIAYQISSKRKIQLIQRDFVENTVDMTVNSLLELNIPIEVSFLYITYTIDNIYNY